MLVLLVFAIIAGGAGDEKRRNKHKREKRFENGFHSKNSLILCLSGTGIGAAD
jgi:hypothetical protein